MPSAALARAALAAAGASHTGLQRENNEDRFHCDPGRGIFMVIDGVGGHAAGEKAAETALTMIRARLERETGQPADRVREAIALANNEIVRLGATEPSWAGMACVLTVAVVRDGRVTVGHVGDTRLYLLGDGGLTKVTHDHSPVGEREDQGEIDEREAMNHPRRNEIYRDVGSERHEPGDGGFVELVEMPFEPDTALLLCTDGLSDMVPSARIARILLEQADDPSQAVERLVEAANQAGGKDNVTAVAVTGPGFADAARRRLRTLDAASGGDVASSVLGRGTRALGRALSSGVALVAYGVVAGLVVAGVLLFLSGDVADRVTDLSRPPGWNRTWRVGAGDYGDFDTIQDALARARPGDLVEVDVGTYDAPIVVPDGVSLVARQSREAVLKAPAGGPGHAAGVRMGGRSRISGFKIEGPGGVATDGDDEAVIEDVEVTGSESGVTFGRGSRGVLRASYVHDNGLAGVVVHGPALPVLSNNVIAANGKRAAGGVVAPGTAEPGPPAVLLQDGASAVFFGNIIAGNAHDEIRGLPADKKADVLRDNIVGMPAPLRTPAPARNRR
jgi:PPM family protein phosphatase